MRDQKDACLQWHPRANGSNNIVDIQGPREPDRQCPKTLLGYA